MNCAEVQKYLSDFLDKSLDIKHTREVEDHLAACSLCSEEMASLAECHRLVSGLAAVEPPVGFTTRVMVEVREAANPPGLWERLFLPLQIKIPLQATAVVLIGVLATYIYQKESLRRESVVAVPPESKQDETDKPAPSVAQAPAGDSKRGVVADKGKMRAQEQESKDSGQLKRPQLLSQPEEPQKPIASNQLAAPQAARSQEQPATLNPAPLQEKPSEASEAATARQEQSPSPAQAKTDLAPVPPPENAAAGAAKPLLAPDARRRGSRATSSLSALRSGTVVGVAVPADQELAVRLKEPGRDDKAGADRLASGDSKTERSSLTSAEAKNLHEARRQAIQTGRSQSLWVTIAPNQYEPFKKELADLGNLEAESSTPERENQAAAKSSDRLRIKITLLPPLPSGSPLPSEPSSR